MFGGTKGTATLLVVCGLLALVVVTYGGEHSERPRDGENPTCAETDSFPASDCTTTQPSQTTRALVCPDVPLNATTFVNLGIDALITFIGRNCFACTSFVKRPTDFADEHGWDDPKK